MSMVEKKTQISLQSFSIVFQILLMFVAVTCLNSIGFAQVTTPSPTPSQQTDAEIIKVNTNLIQIETIVKDKNGKTVTDLTANDFELVEGEKIRPIDFFSFVPLNSDKQVIDSTNKTLAPHELKRTFVFIVSNPFLSYFWTISTKFGMNSGTINSNQFTMGGVQRVSKFLEKFSNEKLGKNDLISIIDTESDLGVLSNFTNEREMLNAAVKQMEKNAGGGKYPQILVSTHATETSVQRSFANLIDQNLRTIKIAQNAVGQLKNLPGRKIVLLLSRGLLRNSTESAIVREKLKSLIEEANQAKVTFYALHLTALGEELGPLNALQDLDSMKNLAEETGGRAIYNTNDVSVGFDEILKENNGYYLLAYNAEEGDVPKPHQIKIRLKRSDLIAQTRSTFYKNESVAETVDKKEMILRILRSPFGHQSIKIGLTPTYKSVSKNQGNIQTVLNIDPKVLEPEMLADGLREVKLDLGIQIIAPDNKLVRQEVKNFTPKLSEESWNITQKEGLVYQFETKVDKPGYYQVKIVGCITKSNQCGSVSQILKTGN